MFSIIKCILDLAKEIEEEKGVLLTSMDNGKILHNLINIQTPYTELCLSRECCKTVVLGIVSQRVLRLSLDSGQVRGKKSAPFALAKSGTLQRVT